MLPAMGSRGETYIPGRFHCRLVMDIALSYVTPTSIPFSLFSFPFNFQKKSDKESASLTYPTE
jgi:hypothetical protein